ncbi:helix-turn-helix domain-containing protein [Tenggerimyces flavus]|uniref:Helix-turn-helix domain-containing protein n=1 Tax=Tenggerimyces flavus TaxID=1708749 RepID=A0ABV7Y6F4_9ACTN|nr:cupin domain-containing protein [Tenggerimyces flavus]MBM7791233.1 transcriptional regulator with XRE-family HTH domain/mannose-6-phosphate isomerase-like protein (cupin superfamily) [Tenggerimyces flavus]
MSPSELPAVGERIRAERLRQDLSLRSLAREVGVSASMISQIETGRSRPSVSTLYAITSALGISIEDVFDAAESAAVPVVSGGPPTTVLEALGSSLGMRLGPLVSPSSRQVLVLDSGVTWERLGALPPHATDFLRITYDPGGTSSSSGELMRHSGSEYGLLLSGELVLTLGFDEHHLTPGDSVSFESSTPHRYRNDGTEPAVGIWFVTG